jgi:hypothetical protein
MYAKAKYGGRLALVPLEPAVAIEVATEIPVAAAFVNPVLV